METELKFRVIGKLKPSQLEQVDWSPFTLGSRENHSLRDTVLDTAGRAITGRMHALRVRRDRDAIYLTLKGPNTAEGDGLHRREELEEAVAEDVVDDLSRWPSAFQMRLQELSVDSPLEPVVEVINERRTWELRQAGRLVAELALDEGRLRAAEATEALHEIEIELKGEGRPEDLDYLARRLKQALPLVAEPRSKLERGLTLRQPLAVIAVEPRAPLAEAGRSVLREHWRQLRESEPGVRAGDPEAVHDMRVATRRLRAMLEVLGATVYDEVETTRLRRGLRRVARALGVVRDAEVWLKAVDRFAGGLADDQRAGLDTISEIFNQRRDQGRAELMLELDRDRTRKLLDRLEHFVTTAGAGIAESSYGPAGTPLLVRDVAGSALWARLEEVQAFAPVMPEASVELLHELRIAGKHLRYTLDLFGDALGGKVKGVRKDLIAAQDHLGELHDADVALPLLQSLRDQHPDNLALSHYQAHLAAERDRLWLGTREVWATIGGNEFRSRLANLIAAL